MLNVNNITMQFGGLTALNDVNMSVAKGEIRGLIGPNGSGKTTLINVISGFYVPTQGVVTLNDKRISGKEPNAVAESGLCRTFQNINLFSRMTALENVVTATCVQHKGHLASALMKNATFRGEEAASYERAYELLRFVGLESKSDVLACNLPYGKQRLLEIARALATNPQLVLLDEPVAGMNEQESDEAAELVRKMRDDGKTILLIEHHMKFVMSLCDQLTVLSSGQVIAEGNPQDIQNNENVIEVYLGKKRGGQSC